MAPGSGGTLFVSIPASGGTVVALLDLSGLPRPGWPIIVPGVSPCGLLLPVDDGSVRLVCRLTNDRFLERPTRAFSFDADGRPRAGWPVELPPGCCSAGRVIGDDLTLFTQRFDRDVLNSVTRIGRDGAPRRGTEVRATGCYVWGVGPDGIAYGMGCDGVLPATALDMNGVRAGWPVSFDGTASAPAFAPDGRIVVVVGPFARETSRVLVFEGDGQAVSARSADLPISTVPSPDIGDTDCVPSIPVAPLVSPDGTIFVFSNMDTPVLALDPSLPIRPGWPFEPATGLQSRIYVDPGHDGITCNSFATPAVAPNSTLYLPLAARDATVGGNIVAVGRDGRVRPGWPVELQRPGSEFWSVVVGSDGTAYSLAIEPEAGDTSSASILAFAPDSTVVYTTTIIEP